MDMRVYLMFILVLVLSHHAESGSIVKFLPGFEGPLPFELETGYIGIGKEEELQTFYYFIKSEKNPKEDPLLIWISGGPGCSSMSGLVFENGPMALKMELYDGNIPSLVSTTYSWTKIVNILYVDQPIGVGFSYKQTPNFDESSDRIEVRRIHEFLQKWLDEYPEFFSNPLYIGGDSYIGKIIPAIVTKISKENYLCCKLPINLQGYVLGNPLTNYVFDYNHRISFAHKMALISDELYKSLKRTCKGRYYNMDPRNTKCLKLFEEYHKCTDKIHMSNILIPQCDGRYPACSMTTMYIPNILWVIRSYKKFRELRAAIGLLIVERVGKEMNINTLKWYRITLLNYWANDEKVREAFNITKGSIGEWHRCIVLDHYDRDIISSVPYHHYNSIRGYRSLIYSGDHDMKVPHSSTEAWINSLNYSIIDHWRPWMINNQIAGYTRTYANNMTFATIKGGGHTIEYKPEEGFIMFQRWINGQNL